MALEVIPTTALANLGATFLANLPAVASAIVPIVALVVLPDLASAILPGWAAAFFPGKAPRNPSLEYLATLELNIAKMLLYTNSKIKGCNSESASSNRVLNLQLKTSYDSLDADLEFFAWVDRLGLRSAWDIFGRLIEQWLEDDLNISQQRKQLEKLFFKVMAAKDLHSIGENGQLKVLGTTRPGIDLAQYMGFDSDGHCAWGCVSKASCPHGQ
ncbi:MAG: hypothetical protein Q9208_003415 [Pyrenodesmia sp. 3 TL-2023]